MCTSLYSAFERTVNLCFMSFQCQRQSIHTQLSPKIYTTGFSGFGVTQNSRSQPSGRQTQVAGTRGPFIDGQRGDLVPWRSKCEGRNREQRGEGKETEATGEVLAPIPSLPPAHLAAATRSLHQTPVVASTEALPPDGERRRPRRWVAGEGRDCGCGDGDSGAAGRGGGAAGGAEEG